MLESWWVGWVVAHGILVSAQVLLVLTLGLGTLGLWTRAWQLSTNKMFWHYSNYALTFLIPYYIFFGPKFNSQLHNQRPIHLQWKKEVLVDLLISCPPCSCGSLSLTCFTSLFTYINLTFFSFFTIIVTSHLHCCIWCVCCLEIWNVLKSFNKETAATCVRSLCSALVCSLCILRIVSDDL